MSGKRGSVQKKTSFTCSFNCCWCNFFYFPFSAAWVFTTAYLSFTFMTVLLNWLKEISLYAIATVDKQGGVSSVNNREGLVFDGNLREIRRVQKNYLCALIKCRVSIYACHCH